MMDEVEGRGDRIDWDDVAMFCYPDAYRLQVYPMQYGDVVEIDHIDELVALDDTYKCEREMG